MIAGGLAALALACGLAASALDASGELQLRRARLALEGPLDGASLTYSTGSATRLELALAAGERREVEVGLVPPRLVGDERPVLSVLGEGSARLLEVLPDERADAAWARVPAGVRARPRPPALDADARAGRPPLAALLLATGVFLFGLGLRGRPLAALASGLAGAALVLVVAAPEPARGRVLGLVEGDAASAWALEVRVARERLGVPPGWSGRLETVPEGAAVDLEVVHDGRGVSWTLAAAAATLVRLDPVELAGELPGRGRANGLGDLEATWVRDPDGTWTRRGPWTAGAPLPAALPGVEEPPGWIHAPLPQGTGVLIGRRAAHGPRPGGAPDERWIRWTGF